MTPRGHRRRLPVAGAALVLFLLAVAGSGGSVPLGAQQQTGCPGAADPAATAGWDALAANELDRARDRFEAALSRCAGHGRALTGLGYVNLREGSTGTARGLFRAAVESDPDEVDARVGLGLLAWRDGDLDRVEREFREVLRRVPDEPTAERYLARAQREREEREAQAVDEAERTWIAGEREEARRLYSARVAADSADVPALHRLALLRAWAGRHDQALELLDRLLDLRPGDVQVRVDRARVLAWRGDTDRAVAALDAILEERPGELRALEAKAEILTWPADEDPFEPAGRILDAELPAPPVGRDARGRQLLPGRPFDAAIAHHASRVEARPDALEPRVALGRVLVFAGRHDSARVVLRRVLDRSPGNITAQSALARSLTWEGRLEEGEEMWRQVVATDPRRVDGWLGLARNLRWQDRSAAALEALDEARRVEPAHPAIEDEQRWLRAELAPRLTPALTVARGGEGRGASITTLVAGWNPLPRADLRVEGHRADAGAGPSELSRTSQGFLASGQYTFDPGWGVAVGLGGIESDGARTPGSLPFRARITSPAGHAAAARLSFEAHPIDETALQIERGLERRRASTTLRWRAGGRWAVRGGAGWSEYRSGVTRRRWDVSAGVERRILPGWSVTAGTRAFGFESASPEAPFFAPDRYALAEIGAVWHRDWERWRIEAEAAPGVQEILAGGDVAATLRGRLRVAYRSEPGRGFHVTLGWARDQLASFATGDPSFSRRTLVVGGRWVVY